MYIGWVENRVYRETTLIASSFIIPLSTLVSTWQCQVMRFLHNSEGECSFNVQPPNPATRFAMEHIWVHSAKCMDVYIVAP